MPWFNPNPSDELLLSWQRPGGTALHKVRKWPHPNSNRLDCRFRVKHTRPVLIPLASRYGVLFSKSLEDYDPLDTLFSGVGKFEFEIRGDNHIGVTTPEHQNGYTIEIDIEGFDVLESTGHPGIRYDVRIDHPTDGFLTQFEEWFLPDVAVPWRHDMATREFPSTINRAYTGASPQFPELIQVDVFAVSECYDFPEPSVGFAGFNGVDAYIELLHHIPATNGPFLFEADIRLRDNQWAPFIAPQSQNSTLGIVDGEGAYSGVRLTLPDLPVFGVWFSYRLEFEWTQGEQLQYDAWIDDVHQHSEIGNRVNLGYDNLGVRNLIGNETWGNFDMRNLILKQGTLASPQTILDMPLIENARDLGPEENHGTPFNMALPAL